MLLGLRRPDGGAARLVGCDPRTTAARRSVGVTPQETGFPLTLRVRELIDLVRAHYERPLAASVVYERFELGRLVARQFGGLSGGERRRVAVALAFAGDPRLVVLDEPTTGLDREARHAVWHAIRSHASAGGAILLTTHHLDEADALAGRLVLVDGGKVVAEGCVDEVKAAAGLAVVRYRGEAAASLAGAVQDGAYVRILTSDAGAEVARLAREGVPLAGLEVRPLTLEEALAARGARP